MAENIKVGIEVSDNGTSSKTQKNVQNLKDVLDQTAVSASRVGRAVASAAGGGRRTGTEAVMAAAVGTGQPSAADLQEYNKLRGAAAVTGASARDFANQAQGLGGVVRLYATFAANIFAVSAAFQSLREAANFERLMRASDMMSERVGTNLRSLGKNLQAATGYAVSFEDAMQFANLGTSAGIAAKQMESLVSIAKGAAVGLGRDVQDSVRRIIQGTAKQEQEILDELGIFIKAKKAYEDFAKKFGIEGGADALSAQQRVAAYADAVEQAGSKWKDFAELDDPFSRFVATGKEALTVILNFINAGIKPLLSFLADSKDAIIALSLAISGILVRRALPDLKNLVLDFFTFNSARAKSQAAELRIGIAKEMAGIANEIQTQQAKLAKLAANTQGLGMAAVVSQFAPGALAATGAKGQAVGPGLSQKQLERAIFGTPSKPVDLASYTKVEQLEQKIASAVNKTIAGNQTKLDQMIQLGVLQNTSTLNELKLSDATKKAAAETFKLIEARRAGLISEQQARERLIQLTAQQQALEQRFQATTPGQIQPVQRMYGTTATGFVGPTQPAPGGSPTGAVAASVAASVAAVGATFSKFSEGLGKVGESTERYKDAIGGGFLTQIKSFGNIFQDNLEIFKTTPGVMGKAGAAVGILGQVMGAAFRGIMAAFGPLMILWTLWELFGDKLMPKAWKEASILAEKQKALADASELAGSTFARFNSLLEKGTLNVEDYGQAIDTVINATRSQVDALKAVLEQQQKVEKQNAVNRAKQEAAASGRVFSQEAFAIDELLKTGIYDPQTKKALQDLRYEYDEYINSTERDVEVKKELDQKALKVLQTNEQYQQKLRAEVNIIESNKKATDDALDSIAKKLKNIPKFGEIASTEEARSFAKLFDELLKPQRTDQAAKSAFEEIQQKLQELTDKGIEPAAQALALLRANVQDVGVQETLKWAKSSGVLNGILTQTIIGVNDITDKYLPETKKQFNAVTAEIDKLGISLKRLDLQMVQTAAVDKRLESLRGFASAEEIARREQQALTKSTLEYQQALRSAELERDKVIRARGTDTPESAEFQAAIQRFNTRKAEIELQRRSAEFAAKNNTINDNISRSLVLIKQEYEVINRQLEIRNSLDQNNLQYQATRLNILKDTKSFTAAQLVALEQVAEQQQIDLKYNQNVTKALIERNQKIKEAEAQLGPESNTVAGQIALQARLRDINTEFKDRIRLAQEDAIGAEKILDLNTRIKVIYGEAATQAERLSTAEQLRSTLADNELQLLNLKKQELDISKDLGFITEDAYKSSILQLESQIRSREYNNKLLALEFETKSKLRDIDTRRTVALELGPLTPEQEQNFAQEKADVTALSEARKKGLTDAHTATERLIDLNQKLSDDQKTLAGIYKNTFEGMSSAIVDFVRTGKLSFKSLINDMLAQIARLYVNRIFMSLFSSMLPGLPGIGLTGRGTGMGIDLSAGVNQAKGGIWDGGIQKFGKGGMFTNSVVDSPTIFKFAKGVGLMGEAGPEAIMPLKRDSQGNLGVRGGGGNSVEVVVNNYSTEQATAKESTDSRGNRRIEVVIGDMTAGEVTRSGSSTQRAIVGTFGVKPQLIRR